MSMFNWLNRKSTPVAQPESQSSGFGQLDATLPIVHPAAVSSKPGSEAPPSKRKVIRLEQRELLYAVVRECMTKSGILSSCYKFKVLSLDSRGKDYLVMVDLPPEHMAHPTRLVHIEGLIARHAKALHDILVTAVYWRVNDQVSIESTAPVAAEPVSASREQRVEAFKQSFANNELNRKSVAPVAVVSHTSPPQAAPASEFPDTELEEPHSPISTTQYGDLN